LPWVVQVDGSVSWRRQDIVGTEDEEFGGVNYRVIYGAVDGGAPAASLVTVVVAALEVEVPVVDGEDVDVGVDDVTGPEDVLEDIAGLDAC
jgi:hypothetical protein